MKTLYAMLGAPGVGKTTFINTVSEEIYGDDRLTRYIIGPDLVRSMVQSPIAKPDGTFGISQENEAFVWKIVNSILDKKVDRGETIIVDATHSRNKSITNYKKYADRGYRIVLIDFSDYANLEEIFRRNKERESFKLVPEHVIETIYERIQDLDIPGWVEVISPKNFKDHITGLKFDWSGFNEIITIGDIHGCSNELNTILERAGIDPKVEDQNKAIVFVGDYFDRGPDQVSVFKTIQQLKKNYYVLPLIGNHEEPLEYYKDFMRGMTEETHLWIKSYIMTLGKKERKITTPTTFWGRVQEFRLRYGFATLKETTGKDYEYILDEKQRKLVRLSKDFLGLGHKHLDMFIEDLREYPEAFDSFTKLVETYKFHNTINMIKPTSRNTFRKFILSDIKANEVSEFYSGLAQLCYVDFHGREVLVTHGGLIDIPTKLTPTSDMIRGVGGYDDTLQADETFLKNTLKNQKRVIGIHGHRNMTDIPVQSTERTFNINGDVDIGLRALVIRPEAIEKIEVEPEPETLKFARAKQIKMAQAFKAKKLSVEEEGSGLIRLFQDHQHVDVKRVPGDIASINFTRKAFEKGHWDNISVKARGLFLGIDTDDNPMDIIIARGYEKFFNLGERNGIQMKNIKSLPFPLFAFEKANGYLGILSVDNRGEKPVWFTASKTTPLGDFADNFRKRVNPHLSNELQDYMIKENVTLLFEVIEPVFDPHIQTYNSPELVLLDAVRNTLQFERIRFEDLPEIIQLMKPSGGIVRRKRLIHILDKPSDFSRLLQEMKDEPIFTDVGHEGYVFETSGEEPIFFKKKSEWYSMWKHMRSQRDHITRKLLNHQKKGNPTVLTKGERIQFKSHLHSADDIKAYKALVELAETDPQRVKNLSIPELRREIIELIQSK